MSRDIKDMVESCVAFQESVGTVTAPLMQVRETPQDMLEYVSADFKGLIGSKYYLHVVIDNLSCYPVVQVVKSTKFSDQAKTGQNICYVWSSNFNYK